MSNVFAAVCHVSQDATVKYLPSGQAVLNVSVANNIGFGDNQKTVWLRVALWGKRAEGSLVEYLKKGQAVFVSGEISMNEYTKNDGTKGVNLELNADILDLVGGKKTDTAQPAAAYYPPATPQFQPPQPVHHQAPPPRTYQTPHEQHRQAVAQHQQQHAPQPYDSDIPF